MPEAWQDKWQPMPTAMPLSDAEVVTGWWSMALSTTLVQHYLLLLLLPLPRYIVLFSSPPLRGELRMIEALTVTCPAVAQTQACWAADSESPTCCLTCSNWVHGVTGIV